jgi:hypothetical protein
MWGARVSRLVRHQTYGHGETVRLEHLLDALHAGFAASKLLSRPNGPRCAASNNSCGCRTQSKTRYLDEALRLFRELRHKLSTGDLFDQGGKPLTPDLPFIDDDQRGLTVGFAKPYIIGYALAGLPELSPCAPDEPKLRDVVRAVAHFLAESQDPIGGWRYPHPRSSTVFMSQTIEHAWQITQAARLLGRSGIRSALPVRR